MSLGSRADRAHDRAAHGRGGVRGRRRGARGRRREAPRRARRPALPGLLPLPAARGARATAISRRSRAASTRSSCAATRTSSARSRRRPRAACARTGSEIKREQEGREGIFHDVPETLPALLYARKVQRRAAAVGFEYPDVDGRARRPRRRAARAGGGGRAAGEPRPRPSPTPQVFDELGDVLFAAVNVARRLNVDPELALRAANAALRGARRARRGARGRARASAGASCRSSEQDRYYDQAKEQLG